MAQIAIHADKNRFARRTKPVDHRRAEAPIFVTHDHPGPAMAARGDRFLASISAVVIHEQHFEVEGVAGSQCVEALQDVRDIFDFPVGRDDDTNPGMYADAGQFIAPFDLWGVHLTLSMFVVHKARTGFVLVRLWQAVYST